MTGQQPMASKKRPRSVVYSMSRGQVGLPIAGYCMEGEGVVSTHLRELEEKLIREAQVKGINTNS